MGFEGIRGPAHPGVGVGKLPLPGEEPTKPQESARRHRGVRGVPEHAGEDTRTAGDGQTGPSKGVLTERAPDGSVRPVASSRTLLTAALVAAGALTAPAMAAGALRADDVRIVSTPASVRVFVEFTGGPPLTGLERQTDALDPEPLDGRAVVRVNATGISSGVSPTTGSGVRVRISQRPGNLVVLLDGAAGTSKFVSYRVSVPRNLLIIDLWRVTTARGARILDDGCLRMAGWSAAGRRARARGRELEPLFEHGLVLTLRGPGGTAIAETPLIATEGVFRPDFSGYAVPGRWQGSTPYSVASRRRAMLEAWAASAKDGSLECLVQIPVVVRP